jgi:hypothetical protein
MVIVRTNVANDTMEAAIVPKMLSAASGPPVIQRGMSSRSVDRSISRNFWGEQSAAGGELLELSRS